MVDYLMNAWQHIRKSHRIITLLLTGYFFFYLINLTGLPIFTDEAIYLDWGWSNTHMPGHLYDSLNDAKQPFIIWLFGIFENFFSDPLFAGRFVSVVIGALSLLGVYKITQKIVGQQPAYVAAALYAIVPIFVFYNRQALLEAGVACAGIWAANALLDFVQKPSIKNAVILGIILGIGFFIKSSSLIFVASALIVVTYYVIWKKKSTLIVPLFYSFVAFFLTDFFLFINPLFWQSFSSNSRYSFTLGELLKFPINVWITNLFGFFSISLVFITPLIFLAFLVGVYLLLRKPTDKNVIFSGYFIFALLLEMVTVKGQSTRYLVAFLPLLVIPAAYALTLGFKKNLWGKMLFCITMLIPFFLSLLFIINPKEYILQTANASSYAETSYIIGKTAGYGTQEAIAYIKQHSSLEQPTLVVFGLNIGNPESAVDVYASKASNLFPLHIDASFFQNLESYQCMTSSYPLFFVTRNDQLLGLNRYFSLEKSFSTHDPNYSIRIYTLKKDCKGNTLSLSDLYLPAVRQELMIKHGLAN